jgi:hypothetical protein
MSERSRTTMAVEEGGTCCEDSNSPGHSPGPPAAWQGNVLTRGPPGLWLPAPVFTSWRGLHSASRHLSAYFHCAALYRHGRFWLQESGLYTSVDWLSESSMTLCSDSSPKCLALQHISHCSILPF